MTQRYRFNAHQRLRLNRYLLEEQVKVFITNNGFGRIVRSRCGGIQRVSVLHGFRRLTMRFIQQDRRQRYY